MSMSTSLKKPPLCKPFPLNANQSAAELRIPLASSKNIMTMSMASSIADSHNVSISQNDYEIVSVSYYVVNGKKKKKVKKRKKRCLDGMSSFKDSEYDNVSVFTRDQSISNFGKDPGLKKKNTLVVKKPVLKISKKEIRNSRF